MQEGSLQLTELCDNLIEHLRDRPLIPQQPDYEDIKRSVYRPLSVYIRLTRNDSHLAHVEGQLAGWSRLNLPKSLSEFGSLLPVL